MEEKKQIAAEGGPDSPRIEEREQKPEASVPQPPPQPQAPARDPEPSPASPKSAEDKEMTMAEALARHEGGGEVNRPQQDPSKSQQRQSQQQPRQGRRRGRRGGRDRGGQGGGENRQRDRGHERGGGRRDRMKQGESRRPGKIKREILANTSFEETRVAILENDRLVELLWERKSSRSIVGDIYKGKVENVLPGISSAFIDIGFDKNAYLYISDVLGDGRKPIDHYLKKNQEVMIQVAKEAIGTKGMKVNMEVTLPGRYLVLSPFSKSTGISKHISDPVERKRISDIVDKLVGDILKGLGLIVRTEAEGASEDELRREANYLMRSWEAIRRRFESQPAPALLHQDLDLPMRIARDLLSDEVYVYLLDSKEVHKDVVDFIGKISPELTKRVQFYDPKTPIFTAFNIEPEIEKLRQTKVPLPSGGTIVIQEAESLCAIDVNTGRFTGSKSQEETVTMNNIEAAEEVAHQLRLRNIGGIIVVDFIDMKKASNRQRVMETFQHAVQNDRAKIRILPITRLGLIEMTRERRRESTISLMTDECPECLGSGRVLSAESMRVRVQREIHELTRGRPGGNIRLVLHPQLADAFLAKQKLIEKNVHRSVKIAGDSNLQWEDYRIILE